MKNFKQKHKGLIEDQLKAQRAPSKMLGTNGGRAPRVHTPTIFMPDTNGVGLPSMVTSLSLRSLLCLSCVLFQGERDRKTYLQYAHTSSSHSSAPSNDPKKGSPISENKGNKQPEQRHYIVEKGQRDLVVCNSPSDLLLGYIDLLFELADLSLSPRNVAMF
nr:hypothetical protein Iba_chr09aCG2310 [Ipomoea batatas]